MSLTTTHLTTTRKIVNLLPPKSISGGATKSHIKIFSMKYYDKVTIIIQFGVVNSSSDIGLLTVEKCTNVAGDNNTAMPFTYRIESTAGGDTLGAILSAESTGFDVDPVFADADNTMITIEIRAEELVGNVNTNVSTTNFDCLSVLLACSGHSVLTSMVAILEGSRYQNSAMPSAIVN